MSSHIAPPTHTIHDNKPKYLNSLESFVTQTLSKWSFPKEAGGFALTGHSRAAAGTGFAIPELGWVFDAGLIAYEGLAEHIFISHTHADHIHQLVYMRSRRKVPNIYVPVHAVSLTKQFLDAALELTSHFPREIEEGWVPSYNLHGVEPGDTFCIKRGGSIFEVEILKCEHSIPCVGYRFSELRKKLKPELSSLSGSEIASLRREGKEVTEVMNIPLFAYLGDTTPQVFRDEPSLLETPLVIVECSFLLPEHREQANKTKHTHWDDLSAIIEKHPDTTFVLIHFSLRYGNDEVHSFFEKNDFPNLIPWLA